MKKVTWAFTCLLTLCDFTTGTPVDQIVLSTGITTQKTKQLHGRFLHISGKGEKSRRVPYIDSRPCR